MSTKEIEIKTIKNKIIEGEDYDDDDEYCSDGELDELSIEHYNNVLHNVLQMLQKECEQYGKKLSINMNTLDNFINKNVLTK